MDANVNDEKVLTQPAVDGQGETLDSQAEKILERHGESQVESEKGKEQPEGQVEPLKEGEQQLPVLEIYEDEVPQLKELGYDENDFNSGELTREDIENILATKTKKEVAETTVVNTEVIITPEMAEKYGGIAKSFIDKPLSELFKAIQKNNDYIAKLSTQIKQHEQLLTENEKTKVDRLEEELKTNTNLSEDEFWTKHKELVKMEAELLARSQAPDPNAAQREAEFYETAQSLMPEGVKFQEISEEWWGKLNPQVQQSYQNLQQKNPTEAVQIMLEAVKNYALLKVKDAAIQTTEKKLGDAEKDKIRQAKILAAKIAKDSIKNSQGQHVQGSKVNIVPRRIEKVTYGDSVIDKIMDRHSER